MILVWERGLTGLVAYKCAEIPTNGSGQAKPHLSSRVLSDEDSLLTLTVLARLYPPPSEAKSS